MTKLATDTTRELGLAAVRQRHGDEAVQQIRNWPAVARNWFTAMYEVAEGQLDGAGDDYGAGKVADEVRAAEHRLDRARRDRDYALNQADMFMKGSLLWPLGTVPSVRWFREFFGHPERDARHEAHVAAGKTLADSITTMKAATEVAAKRLPKLGMTPEDIEREGQAEAVIAAPTPLAVDSAEVERRRQEAREAREREGGGS